MPRRPVTTYEEFQEVVEDVVQEDLKFEPEQARRFFVNNFITRTFARLFGTALDKPIALKATTAGELKVAPVGAGYEFNDTKSGSATDTWSPALTFDQIVSRIDLTIWDNPAIIGRTIDGVTWQDDIEVPANTMYSFDASTKAVRIKNKTAGAVARYQFVGWY